MCPSAPLPGAPGVVQPHQGRGRRPPAPHCLTRRRGDPQAATSWCLLWWWVSPPTLPQPAWAPLCPAGTTPHCFQGVDAKALPTHCIVGAGSLARVQLLVVRCPPRPLSAGSYPPSREALPISQAEAVSPVQTSEPIPSGSGGRQPSSGMRESALLQVLQATALTWLTSWETLTQPALLAQGRAQ